MKKISVTLFIVSALALTTACGQEGDGTEAFATADEAGTDESAIMQVEDGAPCEMKSGNIIGVEPGFYDEGATFTYYGKTKQGNSYSVDYTCTNGKWAAGKPTWN